MSTIQRTETTCDLCGYGGPYTRPEDFTERPGGVDLCRWCMHPRAEAGARTSCGQHEVTFTDDGWTCSCGVVYRPPFHIPARVIAAVPDLRTAVAVNHVQR